MGVDFIGRGDFSLPWHMWRPCFELAVAFGWQPAGTIAHPDFKGHWSGTYFANDCQEVSDEDARAMAEALYGALSALKPKQKLTAEQRKAWADEDVGVFSVFHLAEYADKGGFAIL